jgi:cytochrome c biogenesis protein CcdA/thiol-disulfide isomerase/thioredoxin
MPLDLVTTVFSFLAGMLTVAAPCVLPLLPVILGGSVGGSVKDRKRPYIIVASLTCSIFLFTLLLKASSSLIGVDQRVWSVGSGLIVIALGLLMLFPTIWPRIIASLGIESKSQEALSKAYKTENNTWSAILTGAALGPVFSSCSPTYGYLIGNVLPNSVSKGVFYLFVYTVGLAIALLGIALTGRKYLGSIKWATNPKGWFQRAVAVLFIAVGVLVATGYDKKVQTWFVGKDFISLSSVEQKLIPNTTKPNASTLIAPLDATKPSYFNVVEYPAPELVATGDWFNSPALKLSELRGKVVLIDFWTYSCINCIRTLPTLQKWQDTYKDQGLVIIGAHAPEFAFEKVSKNVAEAINDKKLTYPIFQDNDFKTWQAYKNQYWPATYLINKDGNVVRAHFGEGEYDQTEKAIRDLLAQNGNKPTSELTTPQSTAPPVAAGQSPETYLGYERGDSRFVNSREFVQDAIASYSGGTIKSNEWSLGGQWTIGPKQSVASGLDSKLSFRFSAKEVYLVLSGGAEQKSGKVLLNGLPVTSTNNAGDDVSGEGVISPGKPRLYKLIKSDSFIKDGLLELTLPAGTSVNAFTFGS